MPLSQTFFKESSALSFHSSTTTFTLVYTLHQPVFVHSLINLLIPHSVTHFKHPSQIIHLYCLYSRFFFPLSHQRLKLGLTCSRVANSNLLRSLSHLLLSYLTWLYFQYQHHLLHFHFPHIQDIWTTTLGPNGLPGKQHNILHHTHQIFFSFTFLSYTKSTILERYPQSDCRLAFKRS